MAGNKVRSEMPIDGRRDKQSVSSAYMRVRETYDIVIREREKERARGRTREWNGRKSSSGKERGTTQYRER